MSVPMSMIALLASPNELSDKNLFAYCDNNPIIREDIDGEFWLFLGAVIGAVIGATVSAVSQYIETGKVDVGVVLVNAVSGAISGALATTGIMLFPSVAYNALLGGVAYVAEETVQRKKPTFEGFLEGAVSGGISGVIGGKGLGAKGLSKEWNTASNALAKAIRRDHTRAIIKNRAKNGSEKDG